MITRRRLLTLSGASVIAQGVMPFAGAGAVRAAEDGKPILRLGILEFGTGSRKVWKGLYNFYLDKLLPGIGRLVSRDPSAYRYLAETIRNFPDERALARELLAAGFGRVFHRPMLSGIVYLHVAEKTA